MPSISIDQRTILVTGANRGIGKAITGSLLAAGAARVYAAVRDPDQVEGLVAEHGDRVVPVRLDLSDPASITAAAETASDVDIVINNAGVLHTVDLLSPAAFEAFAHEHDVNVLGLLRVAQAFATQLAGRDGAAFVQLNSVASIKAFSGFATYSASKAASYSLTQSLRELMGERGIHVLSVHPGPIATDMAASAGITDMAVPPSHVAEGIVTALGEGAFHLFPDPMAEQIWEAYAGFAGNVVEADLMKDA